MKLKVDLEADALYLTLDDSSALESEEISPGIILDYNADRQVVGIEMLYLSKRTPNLDSGKLLFEMARISRGTVSGAMKSSES